MDSDGQCDKTYGTRSQRSGSLLKELEGFDVSEIHTAAGKEK